MSQTPTSFCTKKMRGGKHYLLSQALCLILLPLSVFTKTATAPIALPGCPDRCGDVEIPYPFGIGKKCCSNNTYEILCNKTPNGFVPRLKILDKEVMGIHFSDGVSGRNVSQIRVRAGKIFSFGCKRRNPEDKMLLDLRRYPFEYVGLNGIVAVGCNVNAYLGYATKQDYYARFGCESNCDTTKYSGEEAMEKPCNGFKCCYTRIAFAGTYNLTLKSKDRHAKNCNFAFFTDASWSPANATKRKVLSEVYMPITLIWYAFPKLKARQDISRSCVDQNANGIDADFCWCEEGFRGNPYLPEGCKDIDECQEAKDKGQKLCEKNICVNTLGSYQCHVKEIWPAILGSCLGSGLLLLAGAIWYLRKLRRNLQLTRRKKKNYERNGGLLLQQQLYSFENRVERTKVFSSEELEVATDNFSECRILGRGGQGTVYKGMLDDGTIVAVKKAKLIDVDHVEEFINEILILSQIHHRHVVKLLGCCLEIEVPILVYEFIAGGNLFQHLQTQLEGLFMGWDFRLRIATEAANAICHLHSSMASPIYHRDIKSTNILVDEKFGAKVSDFGTSRTITIDQTHLTTIVSGTLGYIDPDYLNSGHFTDRSDVYSFGVVLVELLTGEKPTSAISSGGTKVLSNHFLLAMQEGLLFDILDARIKDQCKSEEVTAVARLAMNCLHSNSKKRPTMKEVSYKLERIFSLRENAGAVMPIEVSYTVAREMVHDDFTNASTTSFYPIWN